MISRTFVVFICLVLAISFMVGCKSVETTSAMLHNQNGRPDLAIELANKALAKNPQDPEAEFQLGVAYSLFDSVGLAFQHYTKALQYDPKREKIVNDNIQSNFAKHYNAGLNGIKEGDDAAAAKEFAKAVQADPRDEKGYFQLGGTYTRLGDASPDSSAARADYYAKAVINFDKVLELAKPGEKYYTDALSFAGQILAKSGRSDEAASRFRRLIEEDPGNYRNIEKIGYDLLNDGNAKSAVAFLDLAAQARAKIGAEDFTLFYNLGVAYFDIGKNTQDKAMLEKAVGYYERALGITPDDPQTVRNIVVAYVYAEDWRKVVEWGERYAGISPNDPDGWRVLTRAYNELGDKEKARRCELRFDELRKRGSGSQ
jgi:tetratricopeptide (TPR) repeat protein